MKYEDAYFYGSYFKHYFLGFLQKIDNTLIPKDQFEAHDSLDGLPDDARYAKLKKLVNELNPLQRNSFKLCLEFLRDLTAHESDAANIA